MLEPAPIGHPPKAGRFKRVCTECGAPFMAAMAHADFCAVECRKSFNNRRMVRGAEIYDLAMALRYQRELATKLGVLKLMWRLCQRFREEDVARRAGRHSWRSPKDIIERHPYLLAEVMQRPTRSAH